VELCPVVVVDVMGGGFKIWTNLGIVFMDDNDSDDVNDAGIDACNDTTTQKLVSVCLIGMLSVVRLAV
jgi:hypothetical protein